MRLHPSMVAAVLRHPVLWPTAIRAYRSLVPDRWWARRPFLPVPDREWVTFRLVTAYGGDGSPPASSGVDVVTWLRWLRHDRPTRPGDRHAR